MAFANKLRDLREAKNLTQEELANMCDVSLKTISRYESGQSKPRFCSSWCRRNGSRNNRPYGWGRFARKR